MDNKYFELEIISTALLKKLDIQSLSFAEFIYQKNLARSKGDPHKEFLVYLYMASQFLKKNAKLAADQWLKNASALVSFLPLNPSVNQDIVLLNKLKQMIGPDEVVSAEKEGKSLLDKMMEGLIKKPMTRIELIEYLFDRVDMATAENRLKNILHRARKQFPNQIVKVGGLYSVPLRKSKSE
ncbi:MAG: hypothetical protein ACXVCP_07460 [Bdellovibrio sp.]